MLNKISDSDSDNSVKLNLFSDKKRLDNKTIQCTHHVENCIHAFTLYMYVGDIIIFIIAFAML